MVHEFEPLYERRRPLPGRIEVLAKEGYAVGAIQVDGNEQVNAIRVAFMRIDGDRLDTQDSYVSEWVGKPTGRQPTTLSGNGALVLGVNRRSAGALAAVGLIFKSQ